MIVGAIMVVSSEKIAHYKWQLERCKELPLAVKERVERFIRKNRRILIGTGFVFVVVLLLLLEQLLSQIRI